MKPVSSLYGLHPDTDIYVVGTGASLRVFPRGLLEGRITIGLNLAWRSVPLRYGITIHPDLNIPEFLEDAEPRPDITWIVKPEKLGGMPADLVRYAEQNFYAFQTDSPERRAAPIDRTPGRDETGRVLEWVRRPTGDYLYLWTSIAQPAVNLAANMGARNVVLVGCDNAPLLGNHHAEAQHTRWLGADPADRYRDYYAGLAEMRGALRERGVNLVSLTPFLTLGPHDDDFRRLCDELEMPQLLSGTDISRSYRAPWQTKQNVGKAGVLRRGLQRVRRMAGITRRRRARRDAR